MATTLLLSVALLAAAEAAPPAEPPANAVFFGKRCGGCHTLGEGDRTGPDLLGVTQRRDRAWIQNFVRNSTRVLDGGDPIANGLLQKFKGVRMPEQPMSDAELTDVLAYLDDCTKKGGCKIVLGKVRPASEATAQEVERGRLLFEGAALLEGGGPPCLSCHNVRGAGILGGGTLAKDLTFAYARLGDVGITSALATTPFPLMKDVFGGRPLRDPEAFQIKAYLAVASKDGTPPQAQHDFLYLGVLGALASLGAIGMAWGGRMRGVRANLVHRSHK